MITTPSLASFNIFSRFIAVNGVSRVTRISFLEHQAQGNETAIEEMKAMQDLPIPSDVRQDEKIRRIEVEIMRLRDEKK